ncbi:division/cell wall cluster transcriptional repressor MraZ [Paracoccus sp. (in: a-proteobacteria)]|uniref:division/cell wall cluster transcriptional repressor MraZ n=1 Tax=Paracoccus sp. TaxID=267 RepID=UPI00289FA9A8|nr:division/cell wall cluster transcriptional repressor MraZ [Paracoccus sp. (in: a-proteobacteria)]
MARRFRGSEEVKVDAKGRVSIPAKFRRVFEACDPDWAESSDRAHMVIVYGTRDWDHMRLYTIEAMDEIDDGIAQMPRGSNDRNYLEMVMHGLSDEAEIDQDGRLVLPQRLREKIGLIDRAIFMASGDHLKLWAPAAYEAQMERIEAQVPNLAPGADPLSLLPMRGAPKEGAA